MIPWGRTDKQTNERTNGQMDGWKNICSFIRDKLSLPEGSSDLGAYLMCIDNKHLTDKVPRGNGTLCWVLDFNLKHNAPSYKYKNYYGRKVWTVNATDVEWVECEHVNRTGLMLQLETQIYDVTSQLDLATKKNQLHKHLQSILEQLRNRLSNEMWDAFGPNWVWWKESFPTFISFQK